MNDNEKISFTTGTNGEILVWETPKGEAAKTERNLAERIDYYVAFQSLKENNVVFIPKRKTVELIIQAWDQFQSHLAIQSDSYVLFNPNEDA